jgi:hypothetical protein
MRFALLSAILMANIVFLFSDSTQALDVKYEGYFRSRGNFYNNLDLDRKRSPANRAYTDLRFRLDPTFYVSDKIRIKSSLNFIDGPMGGNPLQSKSYNNPAETFDRLVDPNQVEGVIGRPATDNSTNAYGGAYAPDGGVDSAGLQALQVRRVWAEFDLPYGTLKVGRMPNQWGIGIFANDGDNPYQEVGSSRDRVMFDTSLGSYYVRPGAGWLLENSLDRSDDDFYEYFFEFGRKIENQNIGIYLSYLSQDGYRNPPGATAFTNAETAYWVFDFYAQHDFAPVNLMAETALYNGKYLGKDLIAINAAARAEWKQLGRWTLLTEAGFSSGTSKTETADGNIKSFAFSRDYDISLLVFEEALPGGKNTRNSAGVENSPATPTAPHSGAISNAMYGRLRIGHDTEEFFKPALNIVVPFAAKENTSTQGSLYGVEYDLITLWPVNHYWTADLSFGHFIPGPLYDGVSRSHSAYLVRAGVLAKF